MVRKDRLWSAVRILSANESALGRRFTLRALVSCKLGFVSIFSALGCIHSFWVMCLGVESAGDGMSKPAC